MGKVMATFPQIVADLLGVDPNNVEIVHGDTSKFHSEWVLMDLVL